ncbi:alkyl hydroperoxide reductase/ Thiol specific antioxidant/ Mal allergen [Segniliparus rotundus DSM 44985]|uniref:thioredoxin-dependent peroxiredoxin n=1 Tax=Segniliparus rotundus (strain ATCC BAA-972 / CDC 1076 / CIP 108378 / DSM 44985 / JCM 13578) TaxID=640132 RepID=D6ZDH8_SEGRD|nr:thioredoxin-dependent thiol peroxidase [Segniliparus rotundus]ADG97242.1 alkyl hydroperoxide reductase/ Thiol specific antioxidant/ Mal allergen [Segniliparus rotundus DSM 44985]
MTESAHLCVGDPAPAFTLESDSGTPVSLSDYAGKQVLVYFYPAASTPGCTKQACDFRDNLAALQDAGIAVVGVSPDPVAKLAKFRDKENLTFPLLADPTKETLTAYGAFGEKKMYGKTVQGVIRSTFLVDEKGVIKLAQYNVKATGHVAKLLRDLGI